MRFSGLWVQGTGSALGELIPVGDAVADGRCPPHRAEKTGIVSVSESTRTPPEMAVDAARAALARAGDPVPGLHLHAGAYIQGPDLSSAACKIAGEVIGPELAGLTMEISALSNGSVAGLELAASVLSGRPDLGCALVTAADQFPASSIDRWTVDAGIVVGDGAAAAVLGRAPGALQLLSVVSFSAPRLEADRSAGHDRVSVLTRTAEGTRRVLEQALAEAECELADARWVLPPLFGRDLAAKSYLTPLGLDPRRTLLEFGLRTGHIGAVDQLLGLDHIVRAGRLRADDLIVLLGVGNGFTFSCAVLRAGERIRCSR
ncbi:3-oxoacyl-[acyl-carrier-protein] synthase III C-terminal domain-containing protein [Amycolatopsis japonica]